MTRTMVFGSRSARGARRASATSLRAAKSITVRAALVCVALLALALLAAPAAFAQDPTTGTVIQTASAPQETFRFPGEFEPHRAVWMAWPTLQYTREYSSVPVVVEMLRGLTPHVPVELLVNSAAIETQARGTLTRAGVPTGNITFRVVPYIDIWLRDMGPIFIVGNKGTKKIVDFRFNGWGLPDAYYVPDDLAVEEDVDVNVAAQLGLATVPSAMFSEGGNREFNGRGTMLAIERTELERNPGWTKAMLEAEYRRTLGVTNVIWVPDGVVEDNPPSDRLWPAPDGTVSAYSMGVRHIDEVARFADPKTILLSEVTAAEAGRDPIAAENRLRLERCYDILSRARDVDGKRFTIVRVPSAEITYYTMGPADFMYLWFTFVPQPAGTTFPYPQPVSVISANGYQNFLVSNGVVLASKYWQPGMSDTIRQKDAQALAALRAAFPGREIVTIDPTALNLGGGGMHCITQQEPR